MNYTYKVIGVSNSRFPSFFLLTLESADKKISKEVIPTIQVTQSKVLLSGEKPGRVPEFEHSKLCIVFAGMLEPELNFNERKKIHSNEDDLVKIRKLPVHNRGFFEVIIDNKNETIFLNELVNDQF